MRHRDPIGYTYEAAVHCSGCTVIRFGEDREGYPPQDATDGGGNPVGALFPWQEWQSFYGRPRGAGLRDLRRHDRRVRRGRGLMASLVILALVTALFAALGVD